MLVEIMKINKEEVATCTSIDVADTFGKRHDHVLRDIKELGCSEKFRLSNFGESSYINLQNKRQPMYVMTRDGFTLLAMGYTGEKAMQFKEAYINQFNAMEKSLKGKLVEREKGIAVRQALTKAIQQSGENDRMHNHAYSVYTDLIYKSLFGKTAKQFREETGMDKRDNLRDYFSREELQKIQNAEMLVSSLMGYGWGYGEIKGFIMDKSISRIAAE